MFKKKKKFFYKYRCTLTEKEYTVNRQAPHPDELVSVKGYYQLHTDEDDRSEDVKRQVQYEEENDAANEASFIDVDGGDTTGTPVKV